MTRDDKIVIYTDGACSGNPGPGGWGALLIYGKHRKEICGGQNDTTNNRMEITAAIRALQSLKKASNIDLYTDSNYLKDGISKWIINWKKNNWKNSAKKPVKNVDLWQELDSLVQMHNINWQWVKGHAGDPGNERADQLANQGMAELNK